MARRRRTTRPAQRTFGPSRKEHFGWGPDDLVLKFPNQPAAIQGMPAELHTILWSLDHVTNQASLEETMINVAHYLADHPGDLLVAEGLRRAEERVEHST